MNRLTINSLTKNLPTPIKLGMRDLGHNKIPTGALILLIAAIIAVFLPPVMEAQSAQWHWRSAEISASHESFARSLEKENNPDLQATWTFYAGAEDPDLGKYSLQVSHVATGIVSFPDYGEQSTTSSGQHFGAISSVLAADWSDPQLAATQTFTQGRAPSAAHEIALSNKLLQKYPGMDELKVGDSIATTTDPFNESDQRGTYTIIGLYDYPSYDDSQPTLLNYRNSALLAESTIIEDALLLDRYFAFGAPLSSTDTLSFAHTVLSNPALTPGTEQWAFAPLIDDEDLRSKVAARTPIPPGSARSSGSETTVLLIATGVLALVTLISVPLYWQNSRRRKLQFAQLERNGVGRSGRLLSRLIPALAIGLSAGVLGLSGAIWRYSRTVEYVIQGSELPPLSHALTLAVTASFLFGVIPPLVASYLAFQSVRTSRASLLREVGESAEQSHKQPHKPNQRQHQLRHGQVASIMALVGLALIVPSAVWGHGDLSFMSWRNALPLAGVLMGFGAIVVAIYFGLAALLPRVINAGGRSPLAARVAGRQVASHLGSSINAIVPAAAIVGLGSATSVIARQHKLEAHETAYASIHMQVAAYLLPVILLVVFFSLLQSTDELRRSRSALSHQGVLPTEAAVIDGYRALILIAVAAVLGYLTGSFAGVMVLIYRSSGAADPLNEGVIGVTFSPAALVPTLATFIIVIVPILLAFPLGWLAGRQNARLVAVTA